MIRLHSKSGIGCRENLPISNAEERVEKALRGSNPQWWSDERGNCPRCVDYQLKMADPGASMEYQI